MLRIFLCLCLFFLIASNTYAQTQQNEPTEVPAILSEITGDYIWGSRAASTYGNLRITETELVFDEFTLPYKQMDGYVMFGSPTGNHPEEAFAGNSHRENWQACFLFKPKDKYLIMELYASEENRKKDHVTEIDTWAMAITSGVPIRGTHYECERFEFQLDETSEQWLPMRNKAGVPIGKCIEFKVK